MRYSVEKDWLQSNFEIGRRFDCRLSSFFNNVFLELLLNSKSNNNLTPNLVIKIMKICPGYFMQNTLIVH